VASLVDVNQYRGDLLIDLDIAFLHDPGPFRDVALQHLAEIVRRGVWQFQSLGGHAAPHIRRAQNDGKLAVAERDRAQRLTPADIVRIRKKLGLTQAQAARVFGGGINAFSKYEDNEVEPSDGMETLLRLSDSVSEAAAWLLRRGGVVRAPALSSGREGCYYRRIMSVLIITSLMRRLAWWQWAWLLLAAVSLPPVSYHAYQTLEAVGRDLRVQLIQRYSLWETDPDYRGTPQAWTRFAAILLNTDQLMQRVREKQGEVADQIEENFRRDAAFAQGKVIGLYLLSWGVPLALLYGAGWLYQRKWRH